MLPVSAEPGAAQRAQVKDKAPRDEKMGAAGAAASSPLTARLPSADADSTCTRSAPAAAACREEEGRSSRLLPAPNALRRCPPALPLPGRWPAKRAAPRR